jgi:hypothetical protein
MKRTSFQCPDTGATILARYAFGRVTLESGIQPADLESIEDEQARNTFIQNTLAYIQRYTNKRIRSLDAASEYLIDISQGQAAWGFDS